MEQMVSARTRRLVVASAFAAVALSLLTLIVIPGSLSGMFSSAFLPHTYCYLFNKHLIALHVGSDAAIWISYVSISCTLLYLVWRTRQEIPFSWMILAFGIFIVACGFTHFMEIVVLWKPLYWLAGDVKLVTALASVITAIALPSLVTPARAMVASATVSEQRRLQLERANQHLQRLSVHIMAVQDEERRRIARELHDGVGQYLAAIKMSCELGLVQSQARQSSQTRGESAAEHEPLRKAIGLLDRCTAEVRTMSHLLYPPLLEEVGLDSAIPWYVHGFTERCGIEVELDMLPGLNRLPSLVELGVFRVLQESLTNVHRHSQSKKASIRFRAEPGRVLLMIRDQGRGFDSTEGSASLSGAGLASMRERVRDLGGELRISSNSQGTTIEAAIPFTITSGTR